MAAYFTVVLAFMLFSSVQKSFGQSSPHNCQDVQNAGQTTNGLATIFLPSQSVGITNPITVFCDQTTGTGGWVVLLRRIDDSEDFPNRMWNDYSRGFGNPTTSSFWLGLENMHQLTRDHHATLRIELEDFTGDTRYAEYSYFRISAESDGYRLFIDGYSGDAGDSLGYHNGQRFSTTDVDNDSHSTTECAERFAGVWWYKKCVVSCLTGEYLEGQHNLPHRGVYWRFWRGQNYSYKRAEMKIRF